MTRVSAQATVGGPPRSRCGSTPTGSTRRATAVSRAPPGDGVRQAGLPQRLLSGHRTGAFCDLVESVDGLGSNPAMGGESATVGSIEARREWACAHDGRQHRRLSAHPRRPLLWGTALSPDRPRPTFRPPLGARHEHVDHRGTGQATTAGPAPGGRARAAGRVAAAPSAQRGPAFPAEPPRRHLRRQDSGRCGTRTKWGASGHRAGHAASGAAGPTGRVPGGMCRGGKTGSATENFEAQA